MHANIAERLRARIRQLRLNPPQLAAQAGVNRSYVYDILRGRSENPNLEKLDRIAEVLKVGRDWLRDGVGDVEGEEPLLTNPDDVYVTVPYAMVKPAMGGGATVEIEPDHGKPYHFQKSWITHGLRADPANLRIMHVVGDSMEPTLRDGDIVLVDMGRAVPTPPGVFVLHDGIGLVAKRLEHIPNSEPPVVRVLSDNKTYSAYERTADEVNIVGRVRWFAREI